MADGLEKKTFLRLARDDGRPGVASFEERVTGIQQQPALVLARGVAVTFETILLQHRLCLLSVSRLCRPRQ